MNEGTVTNNRLGTIMYFTRCNSKTGRCQIFMSRKQGTKWSVAELVEIFGDTVNVGQPSLSKDQRSCTLLPTTLKAVMAGKTSVHEQGS